MKNFCWTLNYKLKSKTLRKIDMWSPCAFIEVSEEKDL